MSAWKGFTAKPGEQLGLGTGTAAGRSVSPVLIVAVIALIIVLAMNSEPRANPPAPEVAPAAVAEEPPPPVADIVEYVAPTGMTHEVRMLGDDLGYRFDPANLKIKSGDAVRFIAVSGFPHNVSFNGLNLPDGVRRQLDANFGPVRMAELSSNVFLSPGEAITISFANIPAGQYEVFCTPHVAMEMRGVIEVVEGGADSNEVGDPGSVPREDVDIVAGAQPAAAVGWDRFARKLIERFEYDITRQFNYTSRELEVGVPYLIRIGGRGGVGPLDATNFQNSMPDAAFGFCGEFQDLDSCRVPITGNRRWPNNWDGVGNRRPSPDEYRANHVYDFYVQGQGRSLRWGFEDNLYSDNRGNFWVEIYRLESGESGSAKASFDIGGGAAPVNQEKSYMEFQVERPVSAVPGGEGPRYPDILRSGGVEGEVLAQFVVDTMGRVELSSFRVIRSDHAMFEQAVRSALPRMRFFPAEIKGQKVKQVVQQPFVFALQR